MVYNFICTWLYIVCQTSIKGGPSWQPVWHSAIPVGTDKGRAEDEGGDGEGE